MASLCIPNTMFWDSLNDVISVEVCNPADAEQRVA